MRGKNRPLEYAGMHTCMHLHDVVSCSFAGSSDSYADVCMHICSCQLSVARSFASKQETTKH